VQRGRSPSRPPLPLCGSGKIRGKSFEIRSKYGANRFRIALWNKEPAKAGVYNN